MRNGGEQSALIKLNCRFTRSISKRNASVDVCHASDIGHARAWLHRVLLYHLDGLSFRSYRGGGGNIQLSAALVRRTSPD